MIALTPSALIPPFVARSGAVGFKADPQPGTIRLIHVCNCSPLEDARVVNRRDSRRKATQRYQYEACKNQSLSSQHPRMARLVRQATDFAHAARAGRWRGAIVLWARALRKRRVF